ncbi:MAG: hypothetical protein KBS55_05215 [Bacteroidales bacterium]|nr:hypothetical protein [Candidatus Cryptobacteroides aphodequi]
MKRLLCFILLLCHIPALFAAVPVRGFSLTSDDHEGGLRAIEAAASYGVNHLQLSHKIVMDLCEIKDKQKAALVNSFIDEAHSAGIAEVVLWDHCLYKMDYYPAEFKVKDGKKTRLDFDNEAFWEWLKDDYRDMLSRVPEADGLVLTFIETGARAEQQVSQRYKTGEEKIAAVVSAVSEVVCKELGKKLYLRTFAYSRDEYATITACINLLPESDSIVLMMKETPHDFILTHPHNPLIGTIDRPTIVEFDTCGEFHGQCIIAGMVPELFAERLKDYLDRPNVIGYTARTDRYGDTQIVGTPAEINLFALKCVADDPEVNADTIYRRFISERYGAGAVELLEPVFRGAYDILTSCMYVMGLNMATHSKMSFDNMSIYSRHVSGRWTESPEVFIGHDINRTFHYWKDIVEHIAPAECKELHGRYAAEMKHIISYGWTTPAECMSEEYLYLIDKEYAFSQRKAEESLAQIRKAENILSPDRYEELVLLYERTLMTIRLRRASAALYWGSRTDCPDEYLDEASASLEAILKEYDSYDKPYPKGQWDWKEDAETAKKLLGI